MQGIKEAMQSVRDRCHDHIDGFVLCVMSMGECGRIRGIDDKTISVDELRRYFDDDNCPSLKGKPRVFIIETCQDGIRCVYGKYVCEGGMCVTSFETIIRQNVALMLATLVLMRVSRMT